MKQELIEEKDFYFNEHGYMVLTDVYLRERGECCGNACLNCPYNYIKVAEPLRSKLLKASKKS